MKKYTLIGGPGDGLTAEISDDSFDNDLAVYYSEAPGSKGKAMYKRSGDKLVFLYNM